MVVVIGVETTAEVEARRLDLDGGQRRKEEEGDTKAKMQAGSRRRSRTWRRRRPGIIVGVGKENVGYCACICVVGRLGSADVRQTRGRTADERVSSRLF